MDVWSIILSNFGSLIGGISLVEVIRRVRFRKQDSLREDSDSIKSAQEAMAAQAESLKAQAEYNQELRTEVATLSKKLLNFQLAINNLEAQVECLNQTINRETKLRQEAEGRANLPCLKVDCPHREPKLQKK